jgi:hypothetical protein
MNKTNIERRSSSKVGGDRFEVERSMFVVRCSLFSLESKLPNSKLKTQTPASAVDCMFGIWGLGLIWSLELGIWSFAWLLTTDNEP